MEPTAPPDRVFVYGTLRVAGGHPMARLLTARARPLGRATVRGILLDAGPYPAAVPSDDERDRIVGELFELDAVRAAETLAALDAYEGCPDGGSEAALYVRARATVEGAHDVADEAWVWFWNRARDGLPRIESGDWICHRGG